MAALGSQQYRLRQPPVGSETLILGFRVWGLGFASVRGYDPENGPSNGEGNGNEKEAGIVYSGLAFGMFPYRF